MARRGHFFPGLLKNTDHFVLGGFVRELGELVLKKDKAQGVLDHLCIRIFREILFQVQLLDPCNDWFRVTKIPQDLTGFLSVKFFERLAPLQVTGARHGIALAGNHPAAKMLRASGQAEFFGSVWPEFQDPVRKPLRINEFARLGLPVRKLDVRVAPIFLIKSP